MVNLHTICISAANSVMTIPPNVRTTATHEFSLSFVLTCDMASDLAMFRDMTKNEYTMQVLLAFLSLVLTGMILYCLFHLFFDILGSDSNYCDR